jgi:hypothetical protein
MPAPAGCTPCSTPLRNCLCGIRSLCRMRSWARLCFAHAHRNSGRRSELQINLKRVSLNLISSKNRLPVHSCPIDPTQLLYDILFIFFISCLQFQDAILPEFMVRSKRMDYRPPLRNRVPPCAGSVLEFCAIMVSATESANTIPKYSHYFI